MSKRIPPLNPLRVFEVVARTLNLTTAAAELHVTQSAVSRQILVLESYLGIELFRRERHGVRLTQAGHNYAEQVVPAFDQIARATARLGERHADMNVRVRTHTTFAATWLIPHLAEFEQAWPDVCVHVINALPDVDYDYDPDPVDLTIMQGDTHWRSGELELLFHEQIEPVCAPSYLSRIEAAATNPEILLGQRLLVSRNRRSDWDNWLGATGLAPQAHNARRMTFSISMLTWQAAIDGLGLAIGQLPQLSRELEQGRLVRPFNRPVLMDRAFYLAGPRNRSESRATSIFREWLVEAVRADLQKNAAQRSGDDAPPIVTSEAAARAATSLLNDIARKSSPAQ